MLSYVSFLHIIIRVSVSLGFYQSYCHLAHIIQNNLLMCQKSNIALMFSHTILLKLLQSFSFVKKATLIANKSDDFIYFQIYVSNLILSF